MARDVLRGVLPGDRGTEFGEPPAPVVARIEAAEVPELDAWLERVVTASQLDDVLGSTPASRSHPFEAASRNK